MSSPSYTELEEAYKWSDIRVQYIYICLLVPVSCRISMRTEEQYEKDLIWGSYFVLIKHFVYNPKFNKIGLGGRSTTAIKANIETGYQKRHGSDLMFPIYLRLDVAAARHPLGHYIYW